MFVTGVVLAAGGSHRLGRPKQLLPYRDATVLDAVLATARSCSFDQLLVTLGGSAEEIRAAVDLRHAEVVVNQTFGSGCASSIALAISAVDPRADGLILLLGDQPGVGQSSVRELVAAAADSRLGVCRYADGRGHPFWFGRAMFEVLSTLHGDKAVWKLLESGRYDVVEAPVAAHVPLDVDTWADYQRLLAAESVRNAR